MFRPLALALAGAAALALPACGAHNDADDVRHALVDWAQALADGRGDDACGDLTPAARAQFIAQNAASGITTCRALVETAHDLATDAQREAMPKLRIRRVIFSDRGTKAIVRDQDVTLPDALQGDDNGRPTVLRRIDGHWKLEDLG